MFRRRDKPKNKKNNNSIFTKPKFAVGLDYMTSTGGTSIAMQTIPSSSKHSIYPSIPPTGAEHQPHDDSSPSVGSDESD